MNQRSGILVALIGMVYFLGCGGSRTAISGNDGGGKTGGSTAGTGFVDTGIGRDSSELDTGRVTSYSINVNPSRKLDLVFLIDNSKGMVLKQTKLKAQFYKLIEALKDNTSVPPLPDLRIAMVNSDLGSGQSHRCPHQYGDRGIFQLPHGTECGVLPGATFLEYKQGKNINFDAKKDIADVLDCLAAAVGQEGCGYEQQLQALNWAFNLRENETQRKAFIREDAYLGIIILTDEDDCSIEPNSLLAAEEKLTTNEAWSLRCATRGHQCGDAKPSYPTTASFEADFSTCKAREDYCDPSETGENPTSCSPLANIKKIADGIKSVKGNDLEKFVVAGIFGWPTEDQTSATYKIAMLPNPNVGQSDYYDYWPICYDPDFPLPAGGPSGRQAFDSAFGWGGFGGLRIKAFLDEFPPESSLAFSICERDYSKIMNKIGATLTRKWADWCLDVKLLDTDVDNETGTVKGAPGVQADCQVIERVPTLQDGQIKLIDSKALPRCDLANGQKPCWRVKADESKCPSKKDGNGKVIVPSQLLEIEGASTPPTNTLVNLACRSCDELSEELGEHDQVPGCM
jgi:hypothetical protein